MRYRIDRFTGSHVIAAFFISFLLLSFPQSYASDITNLALYSDDNGTTTTPASAMTPADEMTFAFNITDTSSLKELSITIYDSSQTTENQCYNTDNQESASRCAWIQWINNSGEQLFTDIRPSQTTWHVDKPNSVISTTSNSIFVFTPSKSSRYSSTSAWVISVRANNGTGSVVKNITANNTYYLEFISSKTSASFEPGRKSTSDHSLSELKSGGYELSYIPFTIISNAPYSWKAKSTDFTGGSTIVVANSTLGIAISNTPSSQGYLNTTYADIESTLPATTDSGDQKQLFAWLDYPDDPDTTYAGTFSMQAYITASPSFSSSEKTISINATTDNTKPSVIVLAPASLAWTKGGYTVSYTINLTDSLSGFMTPVATKKCSVYFGSQKVSEVSFTKNPSYSTGNCVGSFTVPSTGNKNVNLNFTVEDVAGNFAYNDTILLQIDLSSINITDVSLVSTEKPNDLDWYFLKDDIFRVVGHVLNNAGDAVPVTLTSYLSIPGATVTVNSTAVSSSSPYTTSASGNIDIEYRFTGSSIGPSVLYLSAKDIMNNTANYNRTFYITNYLNNLRVLTNFTDKIYTEGDNISVEIIAGKDSSPVYLANITATVRDQAGNIVHVLAAATDVSGKAKIYVDIPKKPSDYYFLFLEAFSPLDTTVAVSNTTTIDTEWLDITAEINSDGYIISNLSTKVQVYGRLDYSKEPNNETFVEGASVTCILRGPGNKYNDTDTSVVNSTGEYLCDGFRNLTKAERYQFEISAEKTISGFKIRGWNKGEYIDITNLSLSQLNNSADQKKQSGINVTSYPVILSSVRGRDIGYNISIKNTGETILKGIALEQRSAVFGNSKIGSIAELKVGTAATLNHSMSVPKDLVLFGSSQNYNISITIRSADGIINTSVYYTLHVDYSLEEKNILNTNYTNQQAIIQKMRRDIDTLLPSEDVKVKSLDSNVKRLESLLQELGDAISKDDYAAGEEKIAEIDGMLSDMSAIGDELKIRGETTLRNIIIAVVILLVLTLAGLYYYMWLPEKLSKHKFAPGSAALINAEDSAGKEGDKKTPLALIADGIGGKNDKGNVVENVADNAADDGKNPFVRKINEFLDKLKKSMSREGLKYDFLKKHRWSES